MSKVDPNTPNNDVGIFFKTSGQHQGASLPSDKLGEVVTGLKVTTAGTVVYKNNQTGAIGVWNVEAGEWYPIIHDQILDTGTVKGIVYNSTIAVADCWWSNSPADALGGAE